MPSMMVSQVVNSFYSSCTYVLDGKWVVDCGDVEPLLPLINAEDFKGVLLTHGHYDHIYGLNELCGRFPQAKVYCSEWTRRQLLDEKLNISFYHEMPFELAFPDRIVEVEDGFLLEIDDNQKIAALSTPGHTPGCVTWMTDEAMFTGDAFIPGIKVVTKLPFGDRGMSSQSVALIQSHAQDRTVFPGHDIELLGDRVLGLK